MSDEIIASSPKQPVLEKYIDIIQNEISDKAIIENYINEVNSHMPTLVIDKEFWLEVAILVKDNEHMKFNSLMNLSGVDYQEYMEVIYHLYSLERDEYLAVKVKTERDGGSVPSVMNIWPASDWQEREVYDLLGIGFTGRKITRILLSDDWVGHPLRKDYVLQDEEV